MFNVKDYLMLNIFNYYKYYVHVGFLNAIVEVIILN